MKEAHISKSRGLRGKIFRLCATLIITASAAFAIIAILQLQSMMKLASDTSLSQNDAIKQRSQATLESMTRESMMNTITLSAEKTDGEFWTMRHDISLLAGQVQDVFEHPEAYGEREIHRPDMANAGQYALQLLFADEEAQNDVETMRMVRKLANLEPVMREIVHGSDEYIRDCYISLANGTSLAMDAVSDQKFEADGTFVHFDPRVRPWYVAAKEKKEFCFTLAVHSFYLELPEVEYGYPIYVDGQLVAVLQGSTKLSTIQKFMSSIGIGENGFSIMVSDEGKLVYSPRDSGELEMVDDLSMDIRNTVNPGLMKLIEETSYHDSGFGEVEIDGEPYYAAYANMPTAGWTQITFVPRSELEQPTDALLAEMDDIGANAAGLYRATFRRSSLLILGAILILLMNAFLATVSFSGRLLNPINVMTGRLEDMTGDRFVFEMDDIYRTGDEIEVLANTFGKLSDQMEDYLRRILAMTAEKEHVGTELAIASRIQSDMLPGTFPPFPERTEFDLFASMDPAKEVGGDFYDFVMVDDDHLAVVIADVSDKGVPAALFMMSAMIIINYRARMGGTPGEILTDANAQLCGNNRSRMFVTVWLGILELSTGKLVCTNAGHEYPIVRGRDGVFREFEDEHGIVVGAIDNMRYRDYELQLQPGDAVFVYTDGVPEACDANGEFYGTERLVTALNRLAGERPQRILEGVRADVDAFVNGAKQFDDLTMVCLEYKGATPSDPV